MIGGSLLIAIATYAFFWFHSRNDPQHAAQ
jgi:hypothetical protein